MLSWCSLHWEGNLSLALLAGKRELLSFLFASFWLFFSLLRNTRRCLGACRRLCEEFFYTLRPKSCKPAQLLGDLGTSRAPRHLLCIRWFLWWCGFWYQAGFAPRNRPFSFHLAENCIYPQEMDCQNCKCSHCLSCETAWQRRTTLGEQGFA